MPIGDDIIYSAPTGNALPNSGFWRHQSRIQGYVNDGNIANTAIQGGVIALVASVPIGTVVSAVVGAYTIAWGHILGRTPEIACNTKLCTKLASPETRRVRGVITIGLFPPRISFSCECPWCPKAANTATPTAPDLPAGHWPDWSCFP
jgi:hypothetical protein